jgi:exodeoxyribonuclease V alpha subunit
MPQPSASVQSPTPTAPVVEQLAKGRCTPAKDVFLPVEAIVVDEASMVDLPLLAWLLRSLDPRTRLIFVGDKESWPVSDRARCCGT